MFNDLDVSPFKDIHLTNSDLPHNTLVDGNKQGILYEKAAPGAFHISDERHDPPKCYEDTRGTVRDDLLDTVTAAVVSCIIWLYGAAGVGKSAIAQSLAEECELQGLLIGSFFFFLTAALRNNAQCLAASLSYQLARSIPSTLQYITHNITIDPMLFSGSLDYQIDKLFVQPLRLACQEDPMLKPVPRIIILDGLDQCDTARVQQHILMALEKALKASPITIVVLVTSRPEIHISSTFDSLGHRASVPTFHFGLNDKYDVDGDIRLYLNDKFKEIRRDHPFKKYLPYVWPHSEDIDSIVKKSSGQFIFAATAIRYIAHHQCNPHERLQATLRSSKRFASTVHDSPFKELDALYFQIFSGVEDQVALLAILFLALNINRDSSQYPRTIAFRLGVSSSDVENKILTLASLMKYDGEGNPIRFFHASLQDFLVDETRSHSLYIKQPAVYTVLSTAYLRHFLASGSGARANALHACSRSLPLAEQGQELSDLAAEAELKMPEFIREFRTVEGDACEWSNDHGSCNYYFGDLVQDVCDLKDVIGGHTRNLTFWDQCLRALHEVLHTQLSVYLTDENTHDYLALVALAGIPVFPRLHFASSWGISESTWDMCCSVDLFKSGDDHNSFHAVIRKLIGAFLLDPHLSRELFTSSEQCARVAMKCLDIVDRTCVAKDLGESSLSDEEATYLCAVRGMTSMLPRASECQRLIDALEISNCRFRWLIHYPKIVEECNKAIKSYLQTHSSKLLLDGTNEQKPCPEALAEPVSEIDVSTGVVEKLTFYGEEALEEPADVVQELAGADEQVAFEVDDPTGRRSRKTSRSGSAAMPIGQEQSPKGADDESWDLVHADGLDEAEDAFAVPRGRKLLVKMLAAIRRLFASRITPL